MFMEDRNKHTLTPSLLATTTLSLVFIQLWIFGPSVASRIRTLSHFTLIAFPITGEDIVLE
jgi:hypothetical protein